MLNRATLSLVWLLACGGFTRGADETWELRGRFEALKPGEPAVVIFRLDDDRRFEIPLDALSEASRATVLRAAAARPAMPDDESSVGTVTVPGPWGRAVAVPVPESIKTVEADAIWCRTAAEAADVYRLFLADGAISAARRGAAEGRLHDWATMAERSLVRLGDRWVPPAEARAAAEEADKVVEHALEVMRLGNADLAEDELRKAARIDPERGRAGFVMGLAYALVSAKPAKAVDLFADVVNREPDNAAALCNLAVLEVATRRYATVAEHFRRAAEHAPDPVPVAGNVAWAVKLAGAAKANPTLAKYKIPEKAVEQLNAVYRLLTQDLKLRPPEDASTPRYLAPDGNVCSATTLAEVASACEAAGRQPATVRRAVGLVVAPGHVICPRDALRDDAGSPFRELVVAATGETGTPLAASEVTAFDEPGLALLRCEGLAVPPLVLAGETAAGDIAVVDLVRESCFHPRARVIRGTVIAEASGATAGRFVHSAAAAGGGGPIVDPAGRLLGMNVAVPRVPQSVPTGGFGIPAATLRALLEKHLPDLPKASAAAVAPDWAAAERAGIAATVFVTGRNRPPDPKATPAP